MAQQFLYVPDVDIPAARQLLRRKLRTLVAE
jgi:hypothetical protein